MALGVYEDDCHNTAKKLPYGFENFNMPSLGEVSGEEAFESRIWVNEEHGEPTNEEAEMLDKIRTIGEETDGDIVNIYDEYLDDDNIEEPINDIDFTSDWDDDLTPIIIKEDGSIDFIP